MKPLMLCQAVVLSLIFVASSSADSFQVNTAVDEDDGKPLDLAKPLALRKAIRLANEASGRSTISFSIGSGLATIQPLIVLPAITNSVVINGYSQPGAQANTDPLGDNAILTVELDGSLTGGGIGTSQGLAVLGANNCEIRGLIIHGFADHNLLLLNGANNNVVAGNWLGLKRDGLTRDGRLDNDGVSIIRSSGNLIGGVTPADRNVISGNGELGRKTDAGRTGVQIWGADATNNLVVGNFIGTDVSGAFAVPNDWGVSIQFSANRIGDGSTAGRNVISGNTFSGVGITSLLPDRTTNNVVRGNYIGLSPDSSHSVPNSVGVAIYDADQNTVGGPAPGDGNIISGNTSFGLSIKTWYTTPSGLYVAGTSASRNVVENNLIGADRTGLLALGNGGGGIFIDSANGAVATGNRVGGLEAGLRAGNLISGNKGDGVQLTGSGTSNNLVQANFIGVDRTGGGSLANIGEGIFLGHLGVGSGSSANNTIGGNDPSGLSGNVISGNGLSGIAITFEPTPTSPTGGGHFILGNLIGTDANGTKAVTNGENGVLLMEAASGCQIGGVSPQARNVISGNHYSGVALMGTLNRSNLVVGNLIGTDTTGVSAIPNAQGVVLGAPNVLNGAVQNTIGGVAASERNVISGNSAGIVVLNGSTNYILGNYVGADATGARSLGNVYGIWLSAKTPGTLAQGNQIGGSEPGAGNLIVFNQGYGVLIEGTNAIGNLLQGNFIGTDSTGLQAMGNLNTGIRIDNAVTNVIGAPPGVSPSAGMANWIANNAGYGVQVTGDAALGNCIRGNRIDGGAGPAILLGAGPAPPPNTPGGGGTGPNEGINYPTLVSTNFDATSQNTAISGWVDAKDPAKVTVDIYTLDSTAVMSWRGLTYLATEQPDGLGWFCHSMKGPLVPTATIVATATSPRGSTSCLSTGPATLRLRALEVNQSIQDWTNSVVLFRGKKTYVRAYLETLDGAPATVSLDDLTPSLHGARNGQELAGAPKAVGFRDLSLLGDASTTRTNLSGSVNFLLPSDWCDGELTLWFAGNGVTCAEARSGSPGTVSSCEKCGATVVFQPSPRLELEIAEVYYTVVNPVTGKKTFRNKPEDVAAMIQRIQAMFPVAQLDLVDETFSWSGFAPLTDFPSAGYVNEKLNSLLAFGSPGDKRKILGLIPGPVPADTVGSAGLGGRVGSSYYTLPTGLYRVSPIHELGHEMGLAHSVVHFAPCTDPLGHPIAGCQQGQCSEPLGEPYVMFPFATDGDPGLAIATTYPGPYPALGPTNAGFYGLFGLDISDDSAPIVMNPRRVFDLMCYCSNAKWDTWVSATNYSNLVSYAKSTFGVHPPPKGVVQPRDAGDWLVVRGTVNLWAGTVGFTPFSRWWGLGTPEAPDPGDYQLRLLAADGTVRYTTTFQPTRYDHESAVARLGGFIVPVANDPAYHVAQVLRAGVVLATQTASPNPPVITRLTPNGGEVIGDPSLTITWTAQDADGDPLTYDVQLSPDGGVTWKGLQADWPDTQLVVDRTYLAGTSNALVRVIASDGFNTSLRVSAAAFTLPDPAPQLFIISPTPNQSFRSQQQIVLHAYTRDPADGWLDGTNVVWKIDTNSVLGQGATLLYDPATLEPGPHVINATAFDHLGQSASASVPIMVYSDLPATYADLGLTMEVSPRVPVPGTNFTLTLDIQNAGRDWARTVHLTNSLPPGLSLISVTAAQATWKIRDGELVTVLDEIAPNTDAAVILTLLATNADVYSIDATVVGPDLDPNLADNSATLSFPVRELLPDLRVSLTTTPDAPGPGDPLTCAVSVYNAGAADATGVSITNTLPANAPLVGMLLSQGSWRTNQTQIIADLGTVSVGSEAALTVVLRPAANGTLLYQVSGGEAEADAEPLDNLMTGIVQVGIPLRLRFSAQGSLVSLEWDDTPNVVLEQTPRLGAGVAWGPAVGTPVLNQGTWSLTIPAGGQSRFYRLKQQ